MLGLLEGEGSDLLFSIFNGLLLILDALIEGCDI